MINMAGIKLKFWGAVVMLSVTFQASASPVQSSQTDQPRDTLSQRLQACTVCHGKEGRATSAGYFPRIAGKPADYLYQQLLNFRDGRRTYAAMTHLLQFLSDDYLREMANHFAGLNLPYPPPQATSATRAVLDRGRALVQQGDKARRIPACVSCHGGALTGVLPAVPGLLGLPRDYITAQLGAWRNGKRRASPQDCMHEIAQRLDPDDVSAVAQWLSLQNLPANTAPAAKPRLDPSVHCGPALK
jgi:cytochrome c553